MNAIINDALREYRARHDSDDRSNEVTTIDLYEDNGGNLIAAKDDGQPWLLGINGLDPQFAGKFAEDAAGWAAGTWEPNEGDGQSQSDTGYETCKYVARWQDGIVTLTRDESGRDMAGGSAASYIGLVLVGDTYETPADAAEYARAEREALAALGDENCIAELAEGTEN